MFSSPEYFTIKEKDIPTVPIEFSEEARQFWEREKKRCIEGYVVNGTWMPPNLYFYINYWWIRQNKTRSSKTKIIDRPKLRDIEWEVLTAWSLCRGMSGFSNLPMPDFKTTEEKMHWLWNLPTGIDLGHPVYENEAKDLFLLASRECGKSMIASGAIVAHEWLFNGQKRYLPRNHPEYENLSTNIIIGAGETKYSNIIVGFFKDGYDMLSQKGLTFGGRYYPHPFIQEYDGSLQPGKSIIAQYEKKIGGVWKTYGTKSTIKHVTYKNNDFAGQGSRNSVMIKDEVGMFENLIQAQENDVETMKSGTYKFGSCFYSGTGGDMDKGTLGAYKMYYSPSTYDLLEFTDRWENKGKIGLFIPVTKRSFDFKDKNGFTDEAKATEFYIKEREKEKKKTKAGYNRYIQYNPLVPSEIFLRTTGNIFPIKELVDVLSELEIKPPYQWNVILTELDNGKIEWTPSSSLNPIMDFPLDQGSDKEGCVVIYEPPKEGENGDIPYERYIAATDPINQVQSLTSESLASTHVLDTWTNKIVAEYTARPDGDKTYFENVRKLLKLYNAKCLYENMFKGMYDYFDYRNELYLLLDQPSYLKDVIPNSKVERVKGMHMNEELRHHGERKLYDWLVTQTGTEDNGKPRLNLHNIKSIPLLKEFLLYDGGVNVNTDRVDSMILLMYYLRQKNKEREYQGDGVSSLLKSKFFTTPLFQKSRNILLKD